MSGVKRLPVFAMRLPMNATKGNFGNTLSAPGLVEQLGHDAGQADPRRPRANIRLQFQAYNVFNQAEFTTIGTTFYFTGANNSVNNNSVSGRYTAVNPGRQLGITARIEF